MMLKKLAAAVTAASMAIIPFPAGNVNVFTPMNVYAEGTGAKAALPDWIPEDFESALEFRNTYGAVHIQDDLICIVYPNRAPKWKSSDTYGYELRTTADMGQKLKQEIYLSDQTETCFEVFVYQPQVHGDLELKLVDPHVQVNDTPDNWGPPTVAEYTFNVDERLDITETDIYGWLPDCAEEYRMYDITHFNVSVKDNYVVFLLPHNAGTAYDWTLNEKGEDCFELAAVSDCSTISAVPLDGGEINTIYAYKAVKDGCDRISYDFGAVYAGGKKEETRTADCAVFNDAQTVLLSGDMRVTLLDFDTDEPIVLGEDEVPMIWTNVEINTSEGVMATGPILEINANPSVVDHSISSFFNADVFSFGLQDAPDGYELPGKEGERSGYYNGKIIPEDQMTVTRFDNGSADVVFRLKNKNDTKQSTRITFYDADTGELIDIPDGNAHLVKYTTEDAHIYDIISKTFDITSNPCTIDSCQVYDKSCGYYFTPETRSGWYNDLQFEITSENSDCIELTFRMKWNPNGDFNMDNTLSISDVVLLQKWLLGVNCTETTDFKAADFCRDNRLDVFDLVLMKRELIKQDCLYVEPDVKVGYAPLTVLEDGLKLYIGPDESYGYVEDISIPYGIRLNANGYQNGNDNWVFVFYRYRYGWIRTVKEDNITPTIMYELICDKPVIYLYPEKETDVHVELELTGAELSTTYPRYNNGWDVTASPDGSLLNKADGTHHKYLFWDAVNCRTRFDFSSGFCVAGSDTESFLKEKLTYMGLTEEEMNEFIVYWLPLMEHNKYNLISFQGSAYTDSAKLDITPEPDSLLRIFMAYVPLENAVDIQPQQLETFERKGFTVVEWGGSEIKL